eukprot:CAMPEP_0119041340 /NCGR_PEP_ID=MMETSP1177-20130426/11567_1 /TAXON_ID=2985 /ORGANISM="Ochromonas sp, Strain CCMP1899" /LENGTH=522 /DNA_ID=CAMNT_0007007311 /DNA_START=1252 /DNA_END=2820 /DNA_ORIENTATION=+
MAVVMKNLLSNAMKFSKQGGVVNIDVSIRNVDGVDKVVIAIIDTGVGLCVDSLGQLFQEGVQINPNALQSGGGSGFGLFIAKTIVELHEGGRIWVESGGIGMGSVFSIELLATSKSQADLDYHLDSPCEPHLPLNTSNEELPSLRILVADDSVTNRKMLVKLLSRHDCVECEDGLAALSAIARSLIHEDLRNSMIPDGVKRNTSLCSILYGVNGQSRKNSNSNLSIGKVDIGNTSKLNNTAQIVKRASVHQFDVVLMDSSMPKMCGPDATMAMRTLGFQGPIIGITGHEDTTEFVLAGADIVLCKPINRKILYDTMKATLQNNLEDFNKGGPLSITNKGFTGPKHISGIQRRRCSTEKTHNSFISDQNPFLDRQSFLYSNYSITGSSENLTPTDNYTARCMPESPMSSKKRSLFSSNKRVGSSYNSVKIPALKEQNELNESVEKSDVTYQAGKKVSSLSLLSSFKSNGNTFLREQTVSRKHSIVNVCLENDTPLALSLSLQKPVSSTHSLSPTTTLEICEAV